MLLPTKHPQAMVPQIVPRVEGHHFVFREEAWAGIADRLNLSQREVEIARCVIAGQRDKQIAHALDVSCNTIQTHMKRLYRS